MRTLFAMLFVVTCTMSVDAQNLWLGRSTESNVGIQFIRPDLSTQNDGFSGVITTASAAIVLHPGTTLILELPFVFSSYSGPLLSNDESALGNPYLGMQFGSADAEYYGEIGFRPPLMSDGNPLASSMGAISDIDRFEAYIPHIVQASAAFDVDRRIGSGLRLLARLGPSADFSTKGSGSTNLYADYGATLEIELENLSLGAGYSARTLLNRSEVDDRTVGQLTLGAFVRVENLEPGLQGRLPLDDYLHRQIDFVYAMSLRVIL